MAAKGNKGGRIIILVALILILVFGGGYLYLRAMQGQQTAQTPSNAPSSQTMVNILVTTQFIGRGTEIRPESLMTVEYPQEKMVQGTFLTDMNEAVGSRAKYDLDTGVALTKSMLIDSSGGSIASFDVPKDYVAMPIPVTQLTSVLSDLASGDHVMVIACMALVDVDEEFQTELPNAIEQITGVNLPAEGPQPLTGNVTAPAEGAVEGRAEVDPSLNTPLYLAPGESNQRPRTVCQSFIQDAVILRVKNETVSAPQTDTAAQTTEGQAQPTAVPETNSQYVTLVVSPQDAIALNYMLLYSSTQSVTLNLALRNPTDTQPIVTDAVTQKYLMDQKNIPLPEKLPYALEPRTDKLEFPGATAVPSTPEQ